MQPSYAMGMGFAIALVATVIATIGAERSSREAWVEVAPAILVVTVLVVGLLMNWESFAPWLGEVIVAAFVIYYLLELRGIVTTNPLSYAAMALGGLVVIVSLVMADVEADATDRQIANAGDALLWASAQVFRSTPVINVEPVTSAGTRLGAMVIVAGLLFSAVLFSAATAWAVRFGHGRDNESQRKSIREQVLAALEEAGLVASEELHEREAMTFVDVDWMAGRQRWGWWTSRERTTAECLRKLEAALEAPTGSRTVFVVDKRAFHVDGSASHQHHMTIRAVPDPAEYIREQAMAGDVVISGRHALVRCLADRGVAVLDELSVPGPGDSQATNPQNV